MILRLPTTSRILPIASRQFFFFPTVLNGHLDLKWQKPVYGVFTDFLTMKNTAELLKFSTVFSAVLMRCARF